jgi:hypothetical protein
MRLSRLWGTAKGKKGKETRVCEELFSTGRGDIRFEDRETSKVITGASELNLVARVL